MHSTNLLTRGDTFFGVCQGLGEDFGFDPIYLRVALAGLLFWNPAVAVGGYAAAGSVVLLSRLVFPNPRPAAAAVDGVEREPAEAGAAAEPEPLPVAA